MRDRCYDILLFLILHERDDSRAPRWWRRIASGFVTQEDAKEVVMACFRSLRFEFEQRETLIMLCNDFGIPTSGNKEKLAEEAAEQLHYETDDESDDDE